MQIIVLLLIELAWNYYNSMELVKVKLWSYYKRLIWLKKVEHHKKINIKRNFDAVNLLQVLI